MNFIAELGNHVLGFFRELGRLCQFFGHSLRLCLKPPIRSHLIIQHMEFVGIGSLFIVLLTGFFTGAVFTIQSIDALTKVGMESMVGTTVLMAVSRELAPVLTSLMVAGRVGSSMATELGTMRVTEQIDAMEVMAVDPIKYLVSPRVIAGAIMVPALTAIFDLIAIVGSYSMAVGVLGIDEGSFIAKIQWFLDPYDFLQGIVKAVFFGGLVTTVGCYKGFFASGGARGVGEATTQSVVISSISIFVLDYILTSILLLFSPAS